MKEWIAVCQTLGLVAYHLLSSDVFHLVSLYALLRRTAGEFYGLAVVRRGSSDGGIHDGEEGEYQTDIRHYLITDGLAVTVRATVVLLSGKCQVVPRVMACTNPYVHAMGQGIFLVFPGSTDNGGPSQVCHVQRQQG